MVRSLIPFLLVVFIINVVFVTFPGFRMSRKSISDKDIAKELDRLCDSSEDEEEPDNYMFNETDLTQDMNSVLDSIQGITYSELLESLESSNNDASPEEPMSVTVMNQADTSEPPIDPSPESTVLNQSDTNNEPPVDLPMPIENMDNDQEYYSDLLHVYSILQNKPHQWSTNVSNFTEHTFEKDLKCSFESNSRCTPVHYFLKLFPEELLELLVMNTNKYAQQKQSKFWTTTTKEEISA